jgi:3-mercaptopyruvate sulfurtransferase SseA
MNLGFALVAAGKHKVLVFMGGWPDWSSAGYPVAKGAQPAGA